MTNYTYKRYRVLEVQKGYFVPQYRFYFFGFIPVWMYLELDEEYILTHFEEGSIGNYCDSVEEARIVIDKHIEKKKYPIKYNVE